MPYVILGSFSFVFLYWFDYNKMQGGCKGNWALNAIGMLLLPVCATMIIHAQPGVFGPWNAVSLCVSALFFLLLIYSLFLELPFRGTYVKDAAPQLIDQGTYALCRHPGVLWLFFTFVFLLGAFPSWTLFAAVVVWNTLNALYVVVQEKRFFTRIFSDYGTYMCTTPMLFPTRASIRRCLQTLHVRRN